MKGEGDVMKSSIITIGHLVFTFALLTLILPAYSVCQIKTIRPTRSGKTGHPEVINFLHISQSKPIRLKSTARQEPNPYFSTQSNHKVFEPPFWGSEAHEVDPTWSESRSNSSKKGRGLRAVQSTSLLASFAGIAAPFAYQPADPIIAAGNGYVLQAVNDLLAVFTSSGSQAYYSALASLFSNVVQPNSFIYDPKVLFDQYSQRWVVLALESTSAKVPPSYYLIATSVTNDPTGGRDTYSILATFGDNDWADFPGLGVDASALYVTSNQWHDNSSDTTFEYSQIFVINKSELYSGQQATYYDFNSMTNNDGSRVSTIKPAHEYGSSGVEYLLNTGNFYVGTPNNSYNYLSLWTITNPLSSPTLTLQSTVGVGLYKNPPIASQAGSGVGLITDQAFISGDVIYRGGDLYTSFATDYNWGSGDVSAIRYDVINANTGAAIIDAEYGADGYFYYPNITVDSYGDICLVFNESSESKALDAGVYWAIRTPFDSQMEGSQILQEGLGPYYTNTAPQRWGDYCGISLDGSNSNEFWLCGMFATSTPSLYGTYIGAVQVTTPTVWSGTEDLYSNLTVPVGANLAISAGTDVHMANNTSLVVNGTLDANGSASQPITFTSASGTSPGSWGSIIFSGSGADNSTLNYCNVEYGTDIEANTTSDVTVENCSITNSSSYGLDVNSSSGFNADYNTIASGNNTHGIVVFGGSGNNCVGNTIYKYSGTTGYQTGAGIQYIAASGNIILNTIYNYNWGIAAEYGSSPYSDVGYSTGTNNLVTNCLNGMVVYQNSSCNFGTYAGVHGDDYGWNSIHSNSTDVNVGYSYPNVTATLQAQDDYWGGRGAKLISWIRLLFL